MSRRQYAVTKLKALFEMVDGMDLVDDVDTEKIHLRGCVHIVHNVHNVHSVPIGSNCRI